MEALSNYSSVGSTCISINTKIEGKTSLNYIYYIFFFYYEIFMNCNFFFEGTDILWINILLLFLCIYFIIYFNEQKFHSNFWFIWTIIIISHNIYLFKLFRLCTLHFRFILKKSLYIYRKLSKPHLFAYK